MKRSQPLRKKRRGNPKNKLWPIFSEYIRRREADSEGMVMCFTCWTRDHWKTMDAGHYIPKSISLALRFHEKNVHPQCTACNRFRHGNLTQYALSLKKKYGDLVLEELDALRRKGEGTKYYKGDYEELVKVYQAKLLALEVA